ncbi:unnamed protein product [Clavelina lepadiformis]|uniref:Cytochrome c oxidase assembly protein COX11 n=1 Tax=Clavelina lepadiformis TaxID=159417 RepID=A0ABP0H466_CLALP
MKCLGCLKMTSSTTSSSVLLPQYFLCIYKRFTSSSVSSLFNHHSFNQNSKCQRTVFTYAVASNCKPHTLLDGFYPQAYKLNYVGLRSGLTVVNNSNIFLSAKLLHYQQHYSQSKKSKISAVMYFCSVLVFMIGLSYAAVPMYRLFCQATGLGGDPSIGHKTDNVATMEPVRERKVNVFFNADHHAAMEWNFKPSQSEITVVPGETALAFYTAKNPTDKPIIGIATYNVVPFQAGLYFNKIQCFCFEEQWLNPNEEVDMPVFFYIDPDFDDDPLLANTDDIILSYTFFKAEEGQTLPLPGFMKLKSVVSSHDIDTADSKPSDSQQHAESNLGKENKI